MKHMCRRDLKKLVKKRRKQGFIVIPTNIGYMFYDPKNRKRIDIWEKKC